MNASIATQAFTCDPPMRASQFLRSATRPLHDGVDHAFGGFDLGTAEGHARFLRAHARILPAVERIVDPKGLLPDWEARAPLLLQDIATLGIKAPAQQAFVLPAGLAARWGALYVLEGSRLGGAVLHRQLPPGAPDRFLAARHPSGAWARLLALMDQADTGPSWRSDALAGASATFRAFAEAAH